MECLRAATANRPNALVLDFFAGSGTTLHSLALLNREDGGRRRCILVTNNEVEEERAAELKSEGVLPGSERYEHEGICRSVTWPRVKYVIAGKRDDGTVLKGEYLDGKDFSLGFEESVEYFRLGFLEPIAVARGEAFEAIVPVLWLIAGAVGRRASSRGGRDWFFPEGNGYAVLLREDAFLAFQRELRTRSDISDVFLVTDSEDAFKDMAFRLTGFRTWMLYRSYLENFRLNTARTDAL